MLILQYLQDEGYLASRMTIHDETNVKYRELDDKLSDIKASLLALRIFSAFKLYDFMCVEIEKMHFGWGLDRSGSNMLFTILYQESEIIPVCHIQATVLGITGTA